MQATGDAISRALEEFAGMDAGGIKKQRREKFLAIGRTI
jgi:hypothetical protein